jgi:hypothetical protein
MQTARSKEEAEIERTEIKAAAESGLITIQVVDGRTGEALPGAKVWHLPVGTAYGDLTPEQQEGFWLDREVFLPTLGGGGLTDSNGNRAVPEGWSIGRHGDLYGDLHVGEQSDARLELFPDHALSVEVFEADGSPAPGVGVRWEARGTLGTLGSTNEAGRIHSPHFGWERRHASSGQLFAPLLDLRVGEVTLHLDDLPDDPVRITLPDVGTLSVAFRNKDGTPADPALIHAPTVSIQAIAGGATLEPVGHWAASDLDTGGRAHFTHVALGRQLTLRLPWGYVDPITIAGPTGDDPHRRLTVTEPHQYPELSGR